MIVVDFSTWGWPQWTMAGIMGLSLFTAAVFHGKPRLNYHIGVAFIDTCIFVAVLWFGGFFS